jgi:hypothetical protein
MPKTATQPRTEDILEQARIDLGVVETFRENERYASRPGDPERQARIDEMLTRMLGFMTPLRSLISRSLWSDDVLTPQQRDEVDRISHRMKLARKQLKKMY